MESTLYPVLTFAISFGLTLVGMPFLLKFCKKAGLYDIPNERKVHHNNIPRMGGVLFAPAMALSMSCAVALMTLFHQDILGISSSTFLLFGALFLIFCIGMIDDMIGLDAKIKFIVQFIASLFMPICNLYINNLYGFLGIYEIPAYVGYPLTIFISLLIINAINLIDGIDGLASGLSVIALTVFTAIFMRMDNVAFAMMCTALLGTVIVFMGFNLFGNAERGLKTFMGDTGSLILGYSFAYLCIKYAMFNPAVFPIRPCPILISFTLVLIPVFDLIRVAFERLLRGKGIFTPDKTHIHHLFLATGISMHRALICILLFQIFFDAANFAMFYIMDISSTWIVVFDILVYAIVTAALKRANRTAKAA